MPKNKENLYFGLLLAVLVLTVGFYLKTGGAAVKTAAKPVPVPCRIEGLHLPPLVPDQPYDAAHPSSRIPVLTWKEEPRSVAYEIELFAANPDQDKASNKPFLHSKQIYVPGFIPQLPAAFKQTRFWWHVRSLDYYSQPLNSYSPAAEVVIDPAKKAVLQPQPLVKFNQGNGTVLLYPVYLWIPIPGAAQYEVEILDAPPENPEGTQPSQHRIDAATDKGFDHYDTTPRLGSQPFYWRVRGLAANGSPVGVYSPARSFTVDPGRNYQVATMGDSISHGGGSFSYAPSNWEFDYQYYLPYPTVNLGRSGDTSADTLARFDEDVLPFHPRYLLIMTGSNSLRSNFSSTEVIIELQGLKDKCVKNGIIPVFITLPPINPANIKRAFDEETTESYQVKFAKVNAYILGEKHVDAAARFHCPDGVLPTEMALDGLHLDIPGKKLIAQAVIEDFHFE